MAAITLVNLNMLFERHGEEVDRERHLPLGPPYLASRWYPRAEFPPPATWGDLQLRLPQTRSTESEMREKEGGTHPDPLRRANPTIVGDRPPGKGVPEPGIPSGTHQLLLRAARNPQLRAEFLERRGAVASSVGITLTPDEQVLLLAVPADQLEILLDSVTPSDERATRKKQREPEVVQETNYPAETGIAPDYPAFTGIAPGGAERLKYKRWQGVDLSVPYRAATGISPRVERLRRRFWLIGVAGLVALLLWWLL